jgi:tRNA (guanine-N7-)-methyltransferase
MKSRIYLSSFGRNRGRTLRPYQQKLVDELLPTLSPPDIARQEDEAAILGDKSYRVEHLRQWVNALLVSAKMEGYQRIALEIGFGGGEHLLAQAAHNPQTLYIGCEPFINGVAKCLAGIDQQKLKNIRLYTRDARELIQALPDNALDEVFILFPDPWPKVRHNKRRLVNHETLAMLARIHKPGGRLLIATDHIDYSEWILAHLLSTPHYRWTAERATDWLTPPADWTETKYQRKTTAEGREPLFFECVRL